jgi:hypothetical protein
VLRNRPEIVRPEAAGSTISQTASEPLAWLQ